MLVRSPDAGWLARIMKHRKRFWAGYALAVLALVAAGVAGKAAYHRHEVRVHTDEVFHDPKVAALAAAAALGNVERVKQLAQEGVNLNTRGDTNKDPKIPSILQNINVLNWVMYMQSPKGFTALLDAGADPEAPSVGGDPVILAACGDVKDPIYLKILLAHGVDPSKLRNNRRTPLQEALLNGNTNTQFYMLLKAGADLEVADSGGNTALISAAAGGSRNYALILDLLKAGANPYAENKGGGTFQVFLRMGAPNTLTAEGKQELAAIYVWLRAHHVRIESPSTTD